MEDLCPVVKLSGIQMVVWKLEWKSLFMVQNKWYSNGPPSHVTTIWVPDTHIVRYSDESGFQVFGIQMVTILIFFLISGVRYSGVKFTNIKTHLLSPCDTLTKHLIIFDFISGMLKRLLLL